MNKSYAFLFNLVLVGLLSACGGIGVDQKGTAAAGASATQVFRAAQAGTETAVQSIREQSATSTKEAIYTAEAQAVMMTAAEFARQQEATSAAGKTQEAIAGATSTMKAKLETEQAIVGAVLSFAPKIPIIII
jgi:hypothetical protein